jgi:hypothetical protein
MRLFISGQGTFEQTKLTPTMQKVRGVLEASKDGELFTAYQLAALVKVNVTTIQHQSANALKDYSYPVGGKRYWGKPSTIKQLVKETKR